MNYTFRMHDPRVGRFFAVDPLAEQAPDKTPYHFCSNNPINRIDPTGMSDDWYLDSDNNFVYDKNITSQKDLDDAGISGRYLGESYKFNTKSLSTGNITNTYNLNSDGSVNDALGNSWNDNFGEINLGTVGGEKILNEYTWGDYWNSPSARLSFPDRISINFSFTASPGVGTTTDFSLNWITRGHDASFIPYAINTAGVQVGTPTLGISAGANVGYYMTGDLRNLAPKSAANDMLGWGAYGSVYGSAYGVEGAINGSVGFSREPFSTPTWFTGGVSAGLGGGTPVGGFIGIGKSYPAFKSQFK